MSQASFDLEHMAELVTFMKETGLKELEVGEGPSRVRLCLPVAGEAATPPAQPLAPVLPPEKSEPAAVSGEVFTSPMVGTFYRSPSPEDTPFVAVGDKVKKGQVLCIIEAMKTLNQIEAEADGVVAAVMAENAQPVEYGEPLFRLETA